MDLCCRASEQIHEHTSDTDQRHAGVSDDGHLSWKRKYDVKPVQSAFATGIIVHQKSCFVT